jgi:hypothetical protein
MFDYDFPPPGRLEWQKGMPRQGAPCLLYSKERRQYMMCVNLCCTEADWGSRPALHPWPDLTGHWTPISPDDLWAYAVKSEREPR